MALFQTLLVYFLSVLAFSGSVFAKKDGHVYDKVCYKSKLGTPAYKECQSACYSIQDDKKTVLLARDGSEITWGNDRCKVTVKNSACGKYEDGREYKDLNVSVRQEWLWEKCVDLMECLKQDQAGLLQANLDKGTAGPIIMTVALKSEFPPEANICRK